jgi:hypothetical protein
MFTLQPKLERACLARLNFVYDRIPMHYSLGSPSMNLHNGPIFNIKFQASSQSLPQNALTNLYRCTLYSATVLLYDGEMRKWLQL